MSKKKKGEVSESFESGLSAYKGHGLAGVKEIPSAKTDKLVNLGITDAEQLIAVASVEGTRPYLAKYLGVSKADLDAIVNEAEKTVPSRLVSILETPGEYDLDMGALEPTEEMVEEMIEEAEAIPIMAPAEEEPVALPSSVNWAKRMPPMRNQGSRGTCVAFALTSLHEFIYQAQNPQDFSEQHIYYETKRIDGIPNACGTWLNKAVKPLADRGQCREHVWPYNPNPPCNNHGTMPPNARADGTNFELQTQALNPKDVQSIKTALATRRVVPFSIPVYNSWYRSAETRRTGRITMPIGNEPRAGGHAMCLIGYQDDPNVPGGGYFILRNSWGTGWGSQCPYGAGNGTIPYQYIAAHNWEAYTARPVSPRPCQQYRARALHYLSLYRRTRNRRYLCLYYRYLAAYYLCLYRVTRNRRYLCSYYRYLAAYYCCLYRVTRNRRYLSLCRRYATLYRRCLAARPTVEEMEFPILPGEEVPLEEELELVEAELELVPAAPEEEILPEEEVLPEEELELVEAELELVPAAPEEELELVEAELEPEGLEAVGVDRCQQYRARALHYLSLYRRTRNRRYLCLYYRYLAAYYLCLYRVTKNRRYLCLYYRYLAAYYCCLYRVTRNRRYLSLCRRYATLYRRCR